MFQSFQLIPTLTARENIQVPLELRGLEAQKRADELLGRVGLSGRGHHYPAQLSGGEQQRVALARAFSHRPRVLFADEPTGNLDAATGARVIELMSELNREVGTTHSVTHDRAWPGGPDRKPCTTARSSPHRRRLTGCDSPTPGLAQPFAAAPALADGVGSGRRASPSGLHAQPQASVSDQARAPSARIREGSGTSPRAEARPRRSSRARGGQDGAGGGASPVPARWPTCRARRGRGLRHGHRRRLPTTGL